MHLVVLVLVALAFASSEGALEDKLHYYEIPTVTIHTISKRSTAVSHTRQLIVSAFGRNFTLELRPSKDLFTNDFKIAVIHGDGSQEIVTNFQRDRFMTGHVVGEPNSQASLHIGEDDLITGMFTADGEEFGIEPMSNHDDGDTDFHEKSTLVMYRQTDIKTDPTNSGLCGSIHPDNVTSGAFEDIKFEQFNRDEDHHRHKRETGPANTCMLVAVADYKYFGHVGQNNLFTTANYISNIINRLNLIYRSTSFNNVGIGFGFELQLMVIHDSPTTSGSDYYYNTAKTNWRTQELLEAFGRTTSNSDKCMALLFTAQPMVDSILGLAYIASSTPGTPGGLCSPYTCTCISRNAYELRNRNGDFANSVDLDKPPLSVRTIGGYRTTLNTGWVTSKNGAGNTLTFTQHSLVTAHAHAWGSEHDPYSGDCAPRNFLGEQGKYLMYAYAVSGEDGNNDRFSSCSRSSVGAVLANKGSSCLQAASAEDPCGNGRIDNGEDCDGGLLGKLGLDPCCSPECLLNPGATCSAANYACCVNCLLASNQVQCQARIEEACLGQSFCDGSSLSCPPAPKLSSVACLDDGTCVNGVCTPFCEYRGLNSCLCDAVETSCRRCCRDSASGLCNVYDNSLLQDGRSCIQGFCSNGVCVKVSTDMIERLWDLIDEISFDFLVESFRTNMVGCVIGFSLALYIPICITIWCVDWRRKKKWEKENNVHIRKDRTLAHDEDKRPIAKPTKPKPSSSHPSTLDPSEFLSPSHLRKPRNQVQPLEHRASSSNA